MLVRVTRQGGSVLDEVFDKMGAEMTKKPRLGGMLDERNYTEGLANGAIQGKITKQQPLSKHHQDSRNSWQLVSVFS